jgi:hypothetical protein
VLPTLRACTQMLSSDSLITRLGDPCPVHNARSLTPTPAQSDHSSGGGFSTFFGLSASRDALPCSCPAAEYSAFLFARVDCTDASYFLRLRSADDPAVPTIVGVSLSPNANAMWPRCSARTLKMRFTSLGCVAYARVNARNASHASWLTMESLATACARTTHARGRRVSDDFHTAPSPDRLVHPCCACVRHVCPCEPMCTTAKALSATCRRTPPPQNPRPPAPTFIIALCSAHATAMPPDAPPSRASALLMCRSCDAGGGGSHLSAWGSASSLHSRRQWVDSLERGSVYMCRSCDAGGGDSHSSA